MSEGWKTEDWGLGPCTGSLEEKRYVSQEFGRLYQCFSVAP